MIDIKKAMFYNKNTSFFITCLGALGILTFYQLTTRFDIVYLLRWRFFNDDAFYYFKVASNVINGQGFSFDGINTTNGYQPLWLYLLIPFRYFIIDNNQFLYAVIILQSVLLSAGIWFISLSLLKLVYTKSPISSRKCWFSLILSLVVIISIALLPPFFRNSQLGLETSLYICMLGITVWYLTDFNHESRQKYLITGLMLGVLNLTRVDSLLLTVIIFFYYLGRLLKKRNIDRQDIIRLVYFLLPIIALLAPYLIYNLITYKTMMPVSGEVKHIYSNTLLYRTANITKEPVLWVLIKNIFWATRYPEYHYVFYLLCINAAGILVYIVYQEYLLITLQLFLILKYFLYAFLYYGHTLYHWYYTIDFIGMALFSSFLVFKLLSNKKRVINGIGLILLIGSILYSGYNVNKFLELINYYKNFTNQNLDNELLQFYSSSMLLNQMDLPSGLIFGMNNSGVFGFYFKEQVVNMDGLINGRVRLEYIRKYGSDFTKYIDEVQPIDAYIDFVQRPAIKEYDDIFLNRGFVFIDINKMLMDQYGISQQFEEIGEMRLYVKRDLAGFFEKNSK